MRQWSWSATVLDRVHDDVRDAWRSVRRAPGFAATVVLTLALGIGANAAMFGVVDELMFRPAPYLRDPSTLNRVYLQWTRRDRTVTVTEGAYARYLDIERGTHSVADVAAFTQRPLVVGVGDGAREREVAAVSASFFRFFDAHPALGRWFAADEDVTPRGASVVVLSHGYWQDEMRGADVLGRTLRVGTTVATIIGVAPAGFVGVGDGPPPAVFIPITTFPAAAAESKAMTYATGYDWDWVNVIVRRGPGVSVDEATADLDRAVSAGDALQSPPRPGGRPSELRLRAIAGPVKSAAGPDDGLAARTLLWVSGVALVVLLIAVANATNLLLARALRARRETAVRLALGVSRARLGLRALIEGMLLALFGACAGVALAVAASGALDRLVVGSDAARSGAAIVLDWRTIALAAVLAFGGGTLAAVIPALAPFGGGLEAALRADARAGAGRTMRLRGVLLVAQAALSVTLLVGAGLFVQSFRNARAFRLGYDADPVLLVQLEDRMLHSDSATTVAMRRRVLAAAQQIPGVAAAARVDSRPFATSYANLAVPGVDSVGRFGRIDIQVATDGYFATMGTRIVRGRAFDARDREGTPLVVVVSQSMARALWPGVDPLGRCIRVGGATKPCASVVGVAEDAIIESFTSDKRLTYYLSIEQYAPSWGNKILLRAADGNASSIAERVRRELQRTMPGDAYVTVRPLLDIIDVQRRSWMLGAALFSAFGVLALLVAAVGLYAVVAYDVAQRARELSVRVALGARAADLLRLVVSRGAAMAAMGVALGAAIAFLAARWMQPLLFEQSARDPVTYAGVGLLLMVVAVLACLAPAVRAARADPNHALRAE